MPPAPFARRPLVEELEPRLLFSADFAPGIVDALAPQTEQRLIGSDGEFANAADSQQAQHARLEVVFIDLRVQGYDKILADIHEQNTDGHSIEIVLLDTERDGIAQIGDFLGQRQDIDAIHLISHGSAGSVELGSGQLNFDSLVGNAAAIKNWGNALSAEADILIYGCDLASTQEGQSLVVALSRLTGADVAASDDKTGHESLGGDWLLEFTTGSIETPNLAGTALQAEWRSLLAATPVTTPIQVNQTIADTQQNADVAIAPDGSFVVVWDSLNDGSSEGVYLRMYNADGTPKAGEVRVNVTTLSQQLDPAIAMNASGQFVVAWTSAQGSTGKDIYARAYNADGSAATGEIAVQTAVGDQFNPDVAIDDSGRFVVTWEGDDTGDASGVFARRYDAVGTALGATFRVNPTTLGNQDSAQVAMDANGAFVVGFVDRGGIDPVIRVSRYDAAGAFQNSFVVNVDTIGAADYVSVDMTTSGFIVAWSQYGSDASQAAVMFRRFDAAGTAIDASEVLANTYQTLDQFDPSVSLADDGRFVITWTSMGQDGNAAGVYGQQFLASGAQDSTEFQVNTYTAASQLDSQVAMRGGRFVVVWEGESGSDAVGVMARAYAVVDTTQVTAGQDTYIKLANTGLNYGASSSLVIDRESTDLQRALLQFDVSTIPSNATIVSATLQMQSTSIAGALNISVYEMLRAWDEGGGSGTADAANWNQSAPGINWTSAGGDYNATAIANLNTSTTGQHAWDLTSLVQAWVNGSNANYGVMIASPDGGGNRTAAYDSSEGATPPRLVITYIANAAPTIANLAGDTLAYGVGSAATVVEQGGNAAVSDIDSANFDTGTLTVSFAAGGVSTQDVLAIRNQGTGVGQIGVSGANVTYAGTTIGTWAGGSGGSNLVITLNADANSTNTSALIQNITYQNTNATVPTMSARTVRFVLTDGDGGTSANFDATVNVTSSTLAVVTTNLDTAGANDGDTSSIAALNANKGSDGLISLREAIIAANNTLGADTIRFNIAGTGVHTITPTTALPIIGGQVIIDATTDDSFAANANRPAIILDGNNLAADGLVLSANADGSTIRGLVIRDFSGDGIEVQAGSDNNTIAGNYVGSLSETGANVAGEGNTANGILVRGANNTIGGINAADRNVLSGNAQGIQITGAGGTGNLIIGNYIGTDGTGLLDVGNTDDGIEFDVGASGNIVGGTTAAERNVISGNNDDGFSTETSGNVVQGNYIGVGADGTTSLANTSDGVELWGNAASNRIGGTAAGQGNLIANNGGDGISVSLVSGTPSGNSLLGNSISSNGNLGIDLGASGVTGNDAGDADTGANSLQNFPVLTSANSNAAGTTIIGTLNSNPNTTYRIEFFGNRPSIADASNGEGERFLGAITVTTDGSGNASYNTTLANVWVNSGDRITATATVDLGGGNYGSTSEFAANVTATSTGIIVVDTTSDTVNGTTTSITNLGNNRGGDGRISLREAIIAANNTANGGTPDKIVFAIPVTDANHYYYRDNGVADTFATAVTTTLADAQISDFDADYLAGTARSWYRISLSGNYLDVTQAVIIDGSTQAGYSVAAGPVIEINAAGITTAGDENAIALTSGASTIRGLVINSAGDNAIEIDVNADNSVIVGNYLGTDVSGTQARGNATLAVFGALAVKADGVVIGGTTAADRNVISGNVYYGIEIYSSASGSSIRGNYIGTRADGSGTLGNGLSGIYLQGGAFNHTIGGTAANEGNLIAGNGGDGVWVGATAGAGNAILGNTIYSNTGLAIDLGANGVTANDAGDADTGANNLLNFPVVTKVVQNGADLDVTLVLDVPAGNYRIEFFENPAGIDSTRYGEGQVFLGALTVTSSGSGAQTFTGTLSGVTPTAITRIAATATVDLGGGVYRSTSEFGPRAGLVVSTTTDNLDGTITSVAALISNPGADGQISLREAITAANATAGTDYIYFDITAALAGGVHTITLAYDGADAGTTPDALPIMTSPVVINGWTEPDYTGNPVIELNGNNVAGAKGLELGAGSSGSTIKGLIINRFTGTGIEISGSNNHVIQGNWIGLDKTGTAAAANGVKGIYALNATGLLIGGTTAAERNVISGNAQQGIYFDNVDNSTISGNYVGTNVAGTGDVNGAVANTAQSGVFLTNGSSGNVVGGTTAGARNILSGNNHFGFEVLFGSQNNLLQGNYIGTDVTGLVALGNINGGAVFWGSGTGNVVGGNVAGARNVIAGNTYNGVVVGSASTGATIEGNYIGVGADGVTDLGNGSSGVKVEGGSTGTRIGTNADGSNDAAEGNVISGNTYGVRVSDSGTNGTVVAGNIIGLAADGSTIVANSSDGVSVISSAGSATIGGATSASRNVISGNAGFGVYLGSTTSGSSVLSNYIGTNAAGNAARANLDGVWIDGSANNTIGQAGAGNLISGNTYYGVVVDAAGATGNVIRANLIGLDAAGTGALGNGAQGILVSGGASSVTIGGTTAGQGNTVAYNAGDGIHIAAGSSVSILGNPIHSNTDQGIDLGTSGVTANDAGDGDAGANNLQNFPVLTLARTDGAQLIVAGTLNSTANSYFRVELFASAAQDGSGFGEGQRYLGAINVATDASGNATISANLAVSVAAGEFITATATKSNATYTTFTDTSEFARNAAAVPIAQATLTVDTESDTADGDTTSISTLLANKGADGFVSLREAIIAANNTANGTSADRITFNIAGSGPHVINLASALPTITQALIIDGSTEPDYTANSPVVRIDGASAGAGVNGITIAGTGGGSTIRGLIITRFSADGINVASGANNVTIAGNWIGTTGAGSTGVGNADDGIDIAASNAIIGGTGANDGNVITNSGDEGINIAGSGVSGHVIQGNYIGVDPDGASGGGNADVGIAILSGSGNTIGGTTAAARNVISKNYEGIEINTSNNVVQGNYIGTDASGTLNRGNRSDDGVEVQGSSTGNLIGGSAVGAGNLIAFNALDGVNIVNGSGHAVLGNAIHSNAGLGIDLGTNGVTANDLPANMDSDSGANNLQNFPVLSTATTNGTQVTIAGSFNSTASSYYRIEFFANASADGTGYGEGQRLLGFADVTTDGSGNATISATLSATVAAGEFISATATKSNAGFTVFTDTSEFAQNVTASFVNTAPTITSNGGGASASISIAENTTQVTTVTATDADVPPQTLSYSISGGADAAKFAINGVSGALTFVSAPNFEAPTDVGGNNVYDVTVQVSDGNGGVDTQVIAVTATNVNEAPSSTGGSVSGTVNTNYVFTWADFNVSDVDTAITASTGVRIGSLPADGKLQYFDGTAWIGVSVNQVITKAVIDAASLRFVPDAGETGYDGYATPGVGNLKQDYAQFSYAPVQGTALAINNPDASANVLAENGWVNPAIGWTSSGADAGAQNFGTATYALDNDNGFFTNAGITASQTLAATFSSASNYSLSADVGWRGEAAYGTAPTFRVELWAGATRLGFFDQTNVTLVKGSFVNGTLNIAGSAFPALDGQALQIRLVGVTSQANYDNLRLTAFSPTADLGTAASMTVDIAPLANSAPTLDTSKSPVLNSVNEDAGAPSGAVGTLISALVDFASPAGQVDNVTDPDGGALGIAITAADVANGTWWYSTNNGSTWNALGAVSESSARLLAADGVTRLYFQSNADWNGTLANAITFRAWDQTSGANGGTANLTTAVADQFGTVAYSSNDGSANWTSSWVETDDDGSASTGNIRIESGKLHLDNQDSGGLESIQRSFSAAGATSATLTFAYDGYAFSGTDSFAFDISNDGGATWIRLEHVIFVDDPGTNFSGSRSFNLQDHLALTGNMVLRFGITAGLAGPGQHVNFDNVQISLAGGATGGSTAFSTVTDTASLTVNPVNDAPVLTTAIAIANSSFESQVLTENGFTSGTITGWTVAGAAVGTWNPDTTYYPAEAPDGQNVAYLNSAGTISQTTTALFAANTDYQLTVAVGDPQASGESNAWQIRLYAGTQLLGFASNADVNPADGTFADVTVTLTAQQLAAFSAHYGQNLRIELYDAGTSADAHFDNVRLTQTASTVAMPGVAYVENGSAVVLNAGVQVFDAELSALNNFNGATLTLARNGGASAQDVFSATGTLSSIIAASGNVVVGGTTIGTYTHSGGTLVFTFNASATNALVNSAMQQIAYSNSSDAPPASVQIDWTFNDGNTGAQGTGGALTATGSTTVNVTAVNDAPVNTLPASFTVAEDTPTLLGGVSIADIDAASGLVTSRLQVNAGTLNVTLAGATTITAGSNGSGDFTLSGTVADINATLAGLTYTGAANANGAGAATLTLTTNDGGNIGTGGARQDVDTATIDITPVNDPAVLSSDTRNLTETNAAVDLSSSGNLTISDVDSPATFVAQAGTAGTYGTFVVDAAGAWTYTASSAHNEFVDGVTYTDTFTVTSADGTTTTVTINMLGTNDAPTTSPVTLVAIAEDSSPRLITQAELLANATDVDGPGLTATGLAISSGNGTLVDNGNGTWTYTPAADDDTSVSFTYTVTDGSLTAAGSANLDITPVNDAPVVVSIDLGSLNEDTPLLITQANLLAGAYDLDTGDTLSAINLTLTAGSGTLTDNGDGTWTFMPDADWSGAASFSFEIDDGTTTTANTASLTVDPFNDAPVIASNVLNIAEGGTVVLNNADLSVADVEQSAAQLTFTISNVMHGQFEWAAVPGVAIASFTQADVDAGLVVFVHDASDLAPSYDVSVSDGITTTGPQAATINFTPVDEGLNVTALSGTNTSESGGTVTFDVALNSQPIADVTIFIVSGNLAEGTASVSSLTFTSANWNIAQQVTVEGQDDFIDDGDQNYAIQIDANSTDRNYHLLASPDVALTNLDDDTAGITMTPASGLVTDESGASDTFSVVLTSQPLANVVIGLSSSNTAEGTLSTDSLTFTPGNWNIPQIVSVTGVNDIPDDGDITYQAVAAPASSIDPNYNGLNAGAANITNLDVAEPVVNDTPPIGPVPETDPLPPPVDEAGAPQPPEDSSPPDTGSGIAPALPGQPIDEDRFSTETTRESQPETALNAGLKSGAPLSVNNESVRHEVLTNPEAQGGVLLRLLEIIQADFSLGEDGGNRISPAIQVDIFQDEQFRVDILSQGAQITAVSLSVGAVWWALRAGGLFTSLLTSLPAWRSFDVLPVLSRDEEDDDASWNLGDEPEDDDNKDDTRMPELTR